MICSAINDHKQKIGEDNLFSLSVSNCEACPQALLILPHLTQLSKHLMEINFEQAWNVYVYNEMVKTINEITQPDTSWTKMYWQSWTEQLSLWKWWREIQIV